MNPPASAPARPKQGSQVEGWSAQPRRIKRHRTTGDVFKGLGALLVLVVLLGAIPAALVRYIGWPLPHHLPSSHFFNQAITPQVLLDALAVIVWLAWAQFVACVAVEFRAAVRGIGMPTRVPAAGPSQFLARQLVAALLMITASAASFVPNLAHLGPGSDASPPAAPVTAAAGVLPGVHQHPAIAPHPAGAVGVHNLPAVRGESGLRVANDSTALMSSDGTKLYRVKPPHGRHHDTLWEIAERHLGDGRRYREIYRLNKDRVQPDGSRLTNAALIRPGWILMMPADAVGGDLVVETAPTAPPAPTSPHNLSPVQPGGIQPGTTQGGLTQGTVQSGPAHASTIQSTPVQPSGIQQTAAQLPSTTSPSALTPVPSSAPPAITQPPVKQSPDNQPPADQQSQPSSEVEVAPPVTVTQSADELTKVATAAVEAASSTTPESDQPAPALPASAQPAPDQTSSDQPAADDASSDQTTTLASAGAGAGAVADIEHQGTTTPAIHDGARSSHRGSHSPEESQPPSTEDRVLYGLAASPLLAAGLLKAIGRHRRRQLWNRVFGRRPVTPNGDGAVAEESIRVGASEVEVWFLDLALRGLSAGLAEQGRTVPAAYAVRLRDEGIELLLNKPVAPDDPAVQPPAPWFTAGDGRSWNFPRPGIVDVDAQAAHRRFAPYPGLVTIGAHGSDRLMIDLEEARGLIGLDGPPEIRRAVLAALAVELATNSWSDRMTVTLVGFPGDLTPLAPARVRHVRTLDEILPSLEIEAGERAKALAAAGLESVLDGRSRANQAGSFPPHFVFMSEEPHAAILARLATIATTTARTGLGFVIAGDIVGATWQLTVGSDRRIAAPALGIEAQAQLLPEEQYAAVLGLFRAVCDIEGTDLAAKPAHQSVGYGGPLPDEPPSVYATLLGPLEVTGVEMLEPGYTALLNEALVFLLHHRDGVHPRVLAAALWPRGTTADVAEETFARLNTWLGTDPHGKPNLHTDAEGRLRLGPYVWSDWDVFVSLQSRALYDASVPDQEQRDDLLKQALDLVHGPYLADREPNRYGWLAYEIAEAQVPAVIADAAFRLAESRVDSGEAEAAIEALKAGMRGSPDDEELWRGLLRATAATGDTERLRGAIEGLYKRTWYVHGVQGLHPRTEALVNELMPDWREAFAA
jgi:hypothetical protein